MKIFLFPSVLVAAAVIGLEACSTAAAAKPSDGDEAAKAVETVKALFALADERRWDEIETSVFADRVLMDFTSLSGGAPAETASADILAAWKNFLPGFFSTHHQAGSFETVVSGRKARVTCRGLALHFLPGAAGGDFWTVSGFYDFALQKDAAGRWRVTAETFNLQHQAGNTGLPALAQENAKNGRTFQKPPSSSEAVKVVEEFFSSLEAMDLERFAKVWAEDGRQLMPLAPPGFPKEVRGKKAVLALYSGAANNFISMKFPRKLYPTERPDKVIARFAGIIPLKDGGSYDNNYAGVFEIENGRIKTYAEHFDPIILEKGFGSGSRDGIVKEKVRFSGADGLLAGDLFLPKPAEADAKFPAVVVAGSWTTVKEQMAGGYALELAARGYAALAFDFPGFGESGGKPRNYEAPEKKIAALKDAVSYLAARGDVDTGRIYGFGICAGAGYVVRASLDEPRLKKLVLAAPWLHDAGIVRQVYGGEEGVARLVARAREAKRKFAASGLSDDVPMASRTDRNAPLYGNWDYYLDPKRGAVSEWDNRFALMSWEDWLTFDAIRSGSSLTAPVLVVHSREAAIPGGVDKFVSLLTYPRKVVWTTGTQFDFYDRKDKMNEVLVHAAEWLR